MLEIIPWLGSHFSTVSHPKVLSTPCHVNFSFFTDFVQAWPSVFTLFHIFSVCSAPCSWGSESCTLPSLDALPIETRLLLG